MLATYIHKKLQPKMRPDRSSGRPRSGRNYVASPPLASSASYQNPMAAAAAALYGSYGGHGYGCKKDDDKLYEILAIGIALMALIQALMATGRRRKKREGGDGLLRGSEMVQDLLWIMRERGRRKRVKSRGGAPKLLYEL